jgi:arylsulfatase
MLMMTWTMRTGTTVRTKTIFSRLPCGLFLSAGSAYAADKPNIVEIWGDDIGESNISAYNFGRMGYRTPNINASPRKA